MDRQWKYLKCNKCGKEGLYLFVKDRLKCDCGEIIPYDESIEHMWLNETDEKGERIRMDFYGWNQDDCRQKAATHFGCNAEDIENYYIVQPSGLLKKYCICATKPKKYTLSPNARKIVHDGCGYGDSRWIIIDTYDKKIIYLNNLGYNEISYAKIIDLIKEEDSNLCRNYTLIAEPNVKIPISFSPNLIKNIPQLIDAIYDQLPISNIGMLTRKYFKYEQIEKIVTAENIRSDFISIHYDDYSYKAFLYTWKDNNKIFFVNEETLQGFYFDLDSIKYYRLIGEKFSTTEISGGGGGGSSIKGAIIGGVIAGDAGAIIGSRKKVEEIKSHTVIHDEQSVLLYDRNLNQVVRFNSTVYDIFSRLIPEKDYDVVIQEKNNEEISVNSNKAEDNLEILDKLATLYNNGVITKEEFDDKKKEILDRI